MNVYPSLPTLNDHKGKMHPYTFQVYDGDLNEDSQEWEDTKARLKLYLPRYRALWLAYHQEKHGVSNTNVIEEKLDVEYEADDEMVICCDKQKCTCGLFSFLPPELLEIDIIKENEVDPEILSEPEWENDKGDEHSRTSSSDEADSSGDSTCVAFDVSWLPSPTGSQATNNDHKIGTESNQKSLKEQITQQHDCKEDDDDVVVEIENSSFSDDSDDKENDSPPSSSSFQSRRQQTIILIDSDDDDISMSGSLSESSKDPPGYNEKRNHQDIDISELKSGIAKYVDEGIKHHRRLVIESSDDESTQPYGTIQSIRNRTSKQNRSIFDGEEVEHDDAIDHNDRSEREVGGLLEKIKALSLQKKHATLDVEDSDSDSQMISAWKRPSQDIDFELVDSDDDIQEGDLLVATSEEEDSRKASRRSRRSKIKPLIKRRDSFIVDSDDEEYDEESEGYSDIDVRGPLVDLRHDKNYKLQQSDKVSKVAFRRSREQLAQAFFAEFDKKVFDGKLSEHTKVVWSNKLRTTAGLTRLKAMRQGKEIIGRSAVVELSTKVLEDSQRLRATLMHELCHAAQWLEDGVSKPPHGEVFKKWARIATRRMPDIPVTVKHDYEISFKYIWKCVQCSGLLKRHSRSINVEKHVCGRCRGRLIEVEADGTEKSRTAKSMRPPSAYNQFIKDNSSKVRRQLEKSQTEKVTQAQVLKQCARMWKEKSNT